MSLKERIRKNRGLATRDVQIPALGETVRVREMSCADLVAWRALTPAGTKAGDMTSSDSMRMVAEVVWRSSFDPETDERLFDTAEDVLALNQSAVTELFNVAADINGMTKKAEESIAGESGPVPSGPSSSDSRGDSGTPTPTISPQT